VGQEEPSSSEGSGVDAFVTHWGWIYVVYQMAEFYRESRDDQYKKGIIEFYNDLAFMEDHSRWQMEIAEQKALEAKMNARV
jgi:hypothetical protein